MCVCASSLLGKSLVGINVVVHIKREQLFRDVIYSPLKGWRILKWRSRECMRKSPRIINNGDFEVRGVWSSNHNQSHLTFLERSGVNCVQIEKLDDLSNVMLIMSKWNVDWMDWKLSNSHFEPPPRSTSPKGFFKRMCKYCTPVTLLFNIYLSVISLVILWKR